jgi:nucleotide-binding universal stress UspA family protein
MTDEPSAQEVAEAAAEIATVAAALQVPDEYNSRERGPGIPIESMNPVWAARAADAVVRGDRPEDSPRVVSPLRRRAREG